MREDSCGTDHYPDVAWDWKSLQKNCPFQVFFLLCIRFCLWWCPHIEWDLVQFLMTYRELSSDLGITDPNFQLSRLFGVTRTFTFTCSHCFSPFLQHAARFLRFIWMHPFPVWPVPTIQSLVCTTIYMNPSSPYEEMVKSHSPCFRPWYSLKSSPRSGSVIHRQSGGFHHSPTVLHSGRVRTGILRELLRKRRTLCTAFSALVSRHCQVSWTAMLWWDLPSSRTGKLAQSWVIVLAVASKLVFVSSGDFWRLNEVIVRLL